MALRTRLAPFFNGLLDLSRSAGSRYLVPPLGLVPPHEDGSDTPFLTTARYDDPPTSPFD